MAVLQREAGRIAHAIRPSRFVVATLTAKRSRDLHRARGPCKGLQPRRQRIDGTAPRVRAEDGLAGRGPRAGVSGYGSRPVPFVGVVVATLVTSGQMRPMPTRCCRESARCRLDRQRHDAQARPLSPPWPYVGVRAEP